MDDLTPSATVLMDLDRRRLVHPLHHPKEHAGAHLFVEGRGAMLRTADGKEYIDGLSCLWNVNAGHGRKELADAAARQMEKLATLAYSRALLDKTVMAHFADDAVQETFWKLQEGGRIAVWGKQLDLGAIRIVRKYDANNRAA